METTNKLFRITKQRLSILDGIVRVVRDKVEMNKSFIEHAIPLIPNSEGRTASLEKSELENKKIELYHDVLHTVTFHIIMIDICQTIDLVTQNGGQNGIFLRNCLKKRLNI